MVTYNIYGAHSKGNGVLSDFVWNKISGNAVGLLKHSKFKKIENITEPTIVMITSKYNDKSYNRKYIYVLLIIPKTKNYE